MEEEDHVALSHSYSKSGSNHQEAIQKFQTVGIECRCLLSAFQMLSGVGTSHCQQKGVALETTSMTKMSLSSKSSGRTQER